MTKGFLKIYVLKLLSEKERSGYSLIKTIEEQTEVWKPSTGSIYPLLKSLEEEGLAEYSSKDDKKVYGLTEEGRAELDKMEKIKSEVLKSVEKYMKAYAHLFDEKELIPVCDLIKRHCLNQVPSDLHDSLIDFLYIMSELLEEDKYFKDKEKALGILKDSILELRNLQN